MTNNIIFRPNVRIEGTRLTPITCLGKNDTRNRKLWTFQCDCGNQTEGSASDVMLGRKLSCGCLQKEHRKNCGKRLGAVNTKPNKAGPLNKLFGNYKRAAKRRKYVWGLSKSKFKKLILESCFYCGKSPNTKYSNAVVWTEENTISYNGIDRKDNEFGYTEENSVSCCEMCNRMKMKIGLDDFLTQIERIYEHQNRDLPRKF